MKITLSLSILLFAGCVLPPMAAAAESTVSNACVGTYRMSDGRDVDIAVSDDTHYRWRMKDGTSGKLTRDSGDAWSSKLGWTEHDDGHRVVFSDCAGGRIKFDQVAAQRLHFDVHETRFDVSGATLAGRLVLPPGQGKVPIVVLVHGAEHDSARDRYALQRLFPSEGIGAFVYDKRGTGGSSGRYTQDFLMLADDAIAALHEARRLAGARAGRMGYQGGSQGGWVAPLAAKIEPADFVIVSFGLAVPPIEEDRAAIVLDMTRHGYGPDIVKKAMEVADATSEVLLSNFREGYDKVALVKQRYGAEPWFKHIHGNVSFFILEKPEAEVRDVGPTFLPGTAFDYDPMPVLRNLRTRQLWILGREDIDAPSAETARRLQTLANAGSPISMAVFPHAEHGMYEFEVAPDGTRLSTRQPAGYFPMMRDFINDDLKDRYGSVSLSRPSQ